MYADQKLFQFSLTPFHANDQFLYPLKTSENHRFPDVFKVYRIRWQEIDLLI